MNISGRAAVVTGGASGIGQAVARRIYADGGNIIIFDLNAEAGAAMVEEMGADRCHFAQVNVADEASVQAGVDSG
ncbi:SDR family NAD(P)-dependent oxidoreductase, partial [Luminiphilus sp.]|nr:SDR family NAD(P)-dependent oxidoreductase [Luminiphilus sp.]